MAFLGESRETNDSPWHIYVCLDKNDCEVLVNSVKALVKRKEKNYNHYKEIHESGEATEIQTTKMIMAEDNYTVAKSIISSIQYFLQLNK